jgi:hypothetical protein
MAYDQAGGSRSALASGGTTFRDIYTQSQRQQQQQPGGMTSFFGGISSGGPSGPSQRGGAQELAQSQAGGTIGGMSKELAKYSAPPPYLFKETYDSPAGAYTVWSTTSRPYPKVYQTTTPHLPSSIPESFRHPERFGGRTGYKPGALEVMESQYQTFAVPFMQLMASLEALKDGKLPTNEQLLGMLEGALGDLRKVKRSRTAWNLSSEGKEVIKALEKYAICCTFRIITYLFVCFVCVL